MSRYLLVIEYIGTNYQGSQKQPQKNANSASGLASRIDALSPLKVMARGFSAVSKDNKYMTNIDKLNVGDNITVEFYDGNIDCTITDKKCK